MVYGQVPMLHTVSAGPGRADFPRDLVAQNREVADPRVRGPAWGTWWWKCESQTTKYCGSEYFLESPESIWGHISPVWWFAGDIHNHVWWFEIAINDPNSYTQKQNLRLQKIKARKLYQSSCSWKFQTPLCSLSMPISYKLAISYNTMNFLIPP